MIGHAPANLICSRRTLSDIREKVSSTLRRRWLGDVNAIAAATEIDCGDAAFASTMLRQHGQVMYGLDKGLWRFRELICEPLPI